METRNSGFSVCLTWRCTPRHSITARTSKPGEGGLGSGHSQRARKHLVTPGETFLTSSLFDKKCSFRSTKMIH